MQYAMLIYGNEDAWFAADEDTVRSNMNEVLAWMEKWQAAGKIAKGGAELDHSRTARTVGRDAVSSYEGASACWAAMVACSW